MNTNKIESAGNKQAAALSVAAIARRRILLRGVGKGVAVIAAAVPIQTLAGQSLLTFDGKHQCSVSGMHSGVHSATTSTAVCGGYSPGWWGQSVGGEPKNWPFGLVFSAAVTSVFTASLLKNSDGSVPTLFQVMDPKGKTGNFSNSDEFHWICAWLNAKTNSFNFPYSADQVVAFYNQGKNTAGYNDALNFFKMYMETHLV